MGSRQNRDLRVQFDRCLKLKSLGSKLTTDTGLLAYRELTGCWRKKVIATPFASRSTRFWSGKSSIS